MGYDSGVDNIIARIKALGDEYKFDTFDGALPVGYKLANENNAPVPYVLYDFGDKGQAGFLDQGITGTRDNMKWTSVYFEVVAPDPAAIRALKSILRDNFEGYVPAASWGELVERYNIDYGVTEPEATEFWPQRFVRSLIYVADVDA